MTPPARPTLAVVECCPLCHAVLVCRYEPRGRFVVLHCSTTPLCNFRERSDARTQRLAQRVRELESQLEKIACAQDGVRDEGTM